ncbi:Protein of unknown function [Anaerovirgula multivorans]|uniref:YetF C-terminal domain-containing protein n=1 Tax=Anaerovirgula multivorans TaxID=312168 RepID=A0A239BLM8_9FIRM|nr:YetF domain-containing protein [Anaerovirgula multivorans]SNS09045.1 Protein of unknown function [Anaerovirgula multivorans]
MDWKSFMEGSKDLSLLALVLRAIILYIALIIATRMMGHRQVGILTGHNYLVAAGIVSLAAIRMINPESSLTFGLVIVFVYAFVNIFLSYLDIKWPKAIDRKPAILIYDGKIDEKNLHQMGLDHEWIITTLTEKGISNLKDVFLAMLEADGTVYVSV